MHACVRLRVVPSFLWESDCSHRGHRLFKSKTMAIYINYCRSIEDIKIFIYISYNIHYIILLERLLSALSFFQNLQKIKIQP